MCIELVVFWCVVGMLLVVYGVYLLNCIIMLEFSIFWICIDIFGDRNSLLLLIGDVNVMLFLVILCRLLSENIWKLFELVRIGLF